MANIVTRSGKGSALSYSEMDANFNNLNGFIGGVNYQTSSLRTINATTPTIIFETQIFDSGGASPWYNSSTGVLTVPDNRAGIWLVGGYVQTGIVNIGPTSSISALIYKNGSVLAQLGQTVGTGNANSFYCVGGMIPIRLVVGDQITFRAFSSVTCNTSILSYQNTFSAVLLGV